MGNLKCFWEFRPCRALAQVPWEMRLEIAFENGWGKRKNANNELLLRLEDYIVYKIF